MPQALKTLGKKTVYYLLLPGTGRNQTKNYQRALSILDNNWKWIKELYSAEGLARKLLKRDLYLIISAKRALPLLQDGASTGKWA